MASNRVSQAPMQVGKPKLGHVSIWLMLVGIVGLQIWLHHDVTDRFFVATQDFQELEFATEVTIPDPWGAFTRPHQGFGYRPLGDLLRAGNVLITDGDPGLLLLRTVIFHSLLIGVVIVLGKVVTGSAALGALVGLVWAFHPPHMSQLGVPMWGAGLGGLMLPAMVTLAFMVEDQRFYPRVLVSILMFLAVLTPWLYEGFLWIVPVFSCWIGLLVYRRYLDRAGLLLILLPLASLIAYFLMRMSVHDVAVQLIEASPSSNYGLKPLTVIVQNIVMHQYATGMVLDHLFFINPLTEAISIGGRNAGLLLALALGLGFSALVYAGAVFLVMQRGFNDMWRLIVMLVLYWTSVSIQMIVTDTTEMYVYLSSIFWYIFAIGVIAKLINRSLAAGSGRRVLAWLLVGLILVPGSVAGTKNRIDALETKGDLIAAQVKSVGQWTAENESGALLLILDCDTPIGFSVYGKTRFAWWGAGSFRRWALGEQKDSLQVIRASSASEAAMRAPTQAVAAFSRNSEFVIDEAPLERLIARCVD